MGLFLVTAESIGACDDVVTLRISTIDVNAVFEVDVSLKKYCKKLASR